MSRYWFIFTMGKFVLPPASPVSLVLVRPFLRVIANELVVVTAQNL
jgi:hypothetical protein